MHAHRYDVKPEKNHVSPSVTGAAFAVSLYCLEASGVSARGHLPAAWKSMQRKRSFFASVKSPFALHTSVIEVSGKSVGGMRHIGDVLSTLAAVSECDDDIGPLAKSLRQLLRMRPRTAGGSTSGAARCAKTEDATRHDEGARPAGLYDHTYRLRGFGHVLHQKQIAMQVDRECNCNCDYSGAQRCIADGRGG